MKLLIGLNLLVVAAIFSCVTVIKWHRIAQAERAATVAREQEESIQAAIPIWRGEGREEAERDIASGRLRLKWYGYMAGIGPRDEKIRDALRDRFGIEVEIVAQDEVSTDLVERVRGYNTRISVEIDRKFGKDAVHKLAKSAGEQE